MMKTAVPYIPESAPFNSEQRAWLNGFIAGLFSESSSEGENGASNLNENKKSILIMFGSQTGTAQGLALQFSKQLTPKGFSPQVVDMGDYKKVDFSKEKDLLIVTSTYGEGEMPDNAQAFWDFLSSEGAPQLDNLNYSVLALGDTAYADFCEAGKNFDTRLEELGGKRIHPRVDCDLEYEESANSWLDGVSKFFLNGKGMSNGANGVSSHQNGVVKTKQDEISGSSEYSRKNPFKAKLITNQILTKEASEKETRHFEISLAGSGLEYEVGDALGVYPQNCPELTEELIKALKCKGDEMVAVPSGEQVELKKALRECYDITKPSRDLIKAIAEKSKKEDFKSLVVSEEKSKLTDYLWGREIIDLLLENSEVRFELDEFVGLLKKNQPRLYSISSSIKAHPDEVHLTVAIVRYDSHGRSRKGVCSSYLADRVEVDEEGVLPVFIQKSHGFRLPEDGGVPIIMVGPGTGVAPFRAFLEERQITKAEGKCWLLFGEQREKTDFLYQEQLEQLKKEGVLTRLDTAFSRDQEKKIYVQHRMVENGVEIWKWLEEGAHFYVCGDASRMAKDVDKALHQIVQEHGKKSEEEATDFVKQLKKNKRYQRDVY